MEDRWGAGSIKESFRHTLDYRLLIWCKLHLGSFVCGRLAPSEARDVLTTKDLSSVQILLKVCLEVWL